MDRRGERDREGDLDMALSTCSAEAGVADGLRERPREGDRDGIARYRLRLLRRNQTMRRRVSLKCLQS